MNTAEVIAHPKWVHKAGGPEAVDYHFQLRGFNTVLIPGSRYLHVEPKSTAERKQGYSWVRVK